MPSGNCIKCGVWRQALHRDHIVPKWQGGHNGPSNRQLLCANCHEDKTLAERKTFGEEQLAKMRAGAEKAKVWTQARRERQRKALSAPDTRALMSASAKKRLRTPHSNETREKIRLAALRRYRGAACLDKN
jgi:hypothetical protein